MKVTLNGRRYNAHSRGILRWLGKHLTDKETPPDFILLDDDQYEVHLHMKEQIELRKQNKKKWFKKGT